MLDLFQIMNYYYYFFFVLFGIFRNKHPFIFLVFFPAAGNSDNVYNRYRLYRGCDLVLFFFFLAGRMEN